MIAAAIDAARGGRLRGASTITQQVMKNFLLSSDRSAERKIKELILAARVEEALSKDKILELYLNEIYLGQNSYGVAAAAQTYFNKTLDRADRRRGGLSRRRCPSSRPTCTRCATRKRRSARRNYRAARDARERLSRQARPTTRRAVRRCRRCRTAISTVSARPAAARLFHRRDPPPAEPRFRRGRVLRRRPDDPRHARPRAAGRGRAGAARRAGDIRPRARPLARHRRSIVEAELEDERLARRRWPRSTWPATSRAGRPASCWMSRRQRRRDRRRESDGRDGRGDPARDSDMGCAAVCAENLSSR